MVLQPTHHQCNVGHFPRTTSFIIQVVKALASIMYAQCICFVMSEQVYGQTKC